LVEQANDPLALLKIAAMIRGVLGEVA